MLWGAGLACALGGAVAGTALGSTPILDRPALGSFYQSHETAAGAARREMLPDHYPLVTREGTVPVAALADRGLYSQRRYRAVYYAADYGPGHAPDAYEPDQPNYESTDQSVRIGDPDHAPPMVQDSEPLDLAAGPASLTQGGGAKTINVEAALAMR